MHFPDARRVLGPGRVNLGISDFCASAMTKKTHIEYIYPIYRWCASYCCELYNILIWHSGLAAKNTPCVPKPKYDYGTERDCETLKALKTLVLYQQVNLLNEKVEANVRVEGLFFGERYFPTIAATNHNNYTMYYNINKYMTRSFRSYTAGILKST